LFLLDENYNQNKILKPTLLIVVGLTSKFFFPNKISTGNFGRIALSKWFWHSLA